MAVTGLGRWLAPGWFKRSHRVNIGLIDGANAPEFADYLFGDFTPTYLPTPVIPVTWNPSDTTADIALSGGDLTATSTAAGSKAVRGTPALTGKPYYEITVSGDASIAVGFHVTTTYAVDNFGVASFAYGASGDIHIVGSAQGVTLGTFGASSAVVSVAIDRPAKLAWFRLNGGDWNDNPSANPATGTGGYGISAYDGFDIAPWAYINTSGGSAVLNAGATAFAYAIPSGFYGPSPSAGSSSYAAAAGLTASATLTGAIKQQAKTAAALTASATLTGAIKLRAKTAAALTASATLVADAAKGSANEVSAAMAALASLTSSVRAQRTAAAALAAAAVLTAAALRRSPSAGGMSASATLAADVGKGSANGVSASLTASATLTSAGRRTARGAADLVASATLAAAALHRAPAASTLSAYATLSANVEGGTPPAGGDDAVWFLNHRRGR